MSVVVCVCVLLLFVSHESIHMFTQPGLGALQETLMRRKESAPPKSYTKRLFENPTLLRQKLLEEANELSEARTKDHVAAEAADVFYFAMVACARAGVKLADVCEKLDSRSLKIRRRPGNAKSAEQRKKWESGVSSSSSSAKRESSSSAKREN